MIDTQPTGADAPPMVADMGAVASAYAAGGALVLPLHTPIGEGGCTCRRHDCDDVGKHPRTAHGKDDATDDADTVTRWWKMWPAANVGIRPRPGQVVVDVDPRNGGGEQFDAMTARYGPLPATRTARTGSGGGHLWFVLHGDVRGKLAPGIDVKSHSGYLVVAPSLHASGERYAWEHDGPIVPAPEWLAALLLRPVRAAGPHVAGGSTPAAAEGLLRVVRDAPDGGLNNALYWACARAAEKGLDVGPLIDAAVEKGHPRRTAERTAESAANAPSGAR